MRVLFVSSGRGGDVGHVVKNQGESLKRAGTEVDYLTISPGFSGYLRAVSGIKKTFNKGGYDLIHVHYSLSALSATLAGVKPIVVSLMGSDVFIPWLLRVILRVLSEKRWDATIVKTDEMKKRLGLKKAHVVPNGVDTDRFAPAGKVEARKHLNLIPDTKLVLFIAAKNRPEKNLPLAINAVESLNDGSVHFIHLYNTPNKEIPHYLNAADLLLLTSSREGSVNVIKEAMACNCPIVSTDVGDVRWVTSGTEGCYISGNDHASIEENIRKAFSFRGRTDGRVKIFELGLDSGSVAQKVIDIYQTTTHQV